MEQHEDQVKPGRSVESSTLRIVDANLNRAREALRVMEEYARFELDDAGLSAAMKDVRHELRHAVESIPTDGDEQDSGLESGLVARRDVDGDVGREIANPSEFRRKDALSVATAAAKRLTEALRVLEEYGKILSSGFARCIEKIRYRAYDLERRVVLTHQARTRFGDVRLYVILTESLCNIDWFETAIMALRGGADCLQLREKQLPDAELLIRARRLALLCREHSAISIINDRPDIAALAHADGVHIGQDDVSVAEARRVVPPHCIVGVSTHTMEQIERAAAAAPDYMAVGPMFETRTKPQDRIAGVETLHAARQQTALPLVAIGGIDRFNVQSVLCSARAAVCVSSAVVASDDPTQATKQLRTLIDASRTR